MNNVKTYTKNTAYNWRFGASGGVAHSRQAKSQIIDYHIFTHYYRVKQYPIYFSGHKISTQTDIKFVSCKQPETELPIQIGLAHYITRKTNSKVIAEYQIVGC